MATHRRFSHVLLVFALTAFPLAANAQAIARCETYTHCALNVVPRWNGLAVVRGAEEQHVATLGFFIPGSLAGAFGPDSVATALGAQAVRTRRVAAVLTDLGALAMLAGAISAEQSGIDARSRALMIGGAAAFGVSVPLQFRADGQLARAVWRFNTSFAAR